MLKLPSLGEMDRTLGSRVYLATGSTDMRKGFDSLAALVRDHLGHDPLSGSLFLFVGRGRDRLKILAWDTDGYCISKFSTKDSLSLSEETSGLAKMALASVP